MAPAKPQLFAYLDYRAFLADFYEYSKSTTVFFSYQYMAQKLGMGLDIVNMDFGQMIPALQDGQVDMIGACITITAERAELVLFSEPYYEGGIAALVKK